jgi:hypothetical protein
MTHKSSGDLLKNHPAIPELKDIPLTLWQKFWHNFMGWHKPYTITGFDGCSIHATCDICGKKGLIDSNGDLF